MITELTITDFAIIDHLQLPLVPGFVVFTGETGAGKSIIIDAVDLLLGGRADPTLVRAGAEVARVEGVFTLPDEVRADVEAILAREELQADDALLEVTLAREVRREGRSVCRINGRSVSLSILKEIGQGLVDVHGQSDHLSLLRPREHVYMLDRFAGLDDERLAVAEMVRELNAVRRELSELLRGEREMARRLDMLDFQLNEIASARLKPGEDKALLEERTRLANAEKIAALADDALRALSDGAEDTPSAADLLGEAWRALTGLAKIDPSQTAARDQALALSEQFRDLARDLAAYRETIEFNPKRLNAVEERLELIKNLQRKYGPTIDDVLAFAGKAQAERDGLTHSGERAAELQKKEDTWLRRIGQAGARLSEARRAAGERLGQAIEGELSDLRMDGAKFSVGMQWADDAEGAPVNGRRVAFDLTGLDRVEFLVAPNPGEGLKPLAKTASGGETSRLMLALKGVLARADRTPTLIFDEIDQGIGGRVGTVVGRKLWDLAAAHQVLCITHLPQLAGFGDQHFKVEKVLADDRTVTRVRGLSDQDRIAELALMLGGAGEKTLGSAEEILAMVQAAKDAVSAKDAGAASNAEAARPHPGG
jgi:DNA repair protein RecN (Recombination protein N)